MYINWKQRKRERIGDGHASALFKPTLMWSLYLKEDMKNVKNKKIEKVFSKQYIRPHARIW